MFTGIIEEVGRLVAISGGKVKIGCSKVLTDVSMGDSISTNGVCLTVESFGTDFFIADVMPETIRRTSFSSLTSGSEVNLERAMAADGRFGGHMVSGHIDGVGRILSSEHEGNAIWVTIACDDDILKYVIEKGSIAIDGISLTVATVSEETFRVSIIPTTAKDTTLISKSIGDIVNLECDIYGKYVERFMTFKTKKKDITMEFLSENGFI